MAVYDLDEIRRKEELLVIEEAANSLSGVEKHITLFYEHCLKWEFQQSHQENDWLSTIVVASRVVACMVNTNVINLISSKLRELYEKGLSKARHITKEDIPDETDVWTSFDSLDKIKDIYYVLDWMEQYSNPNKPDFVGKRREKLNKEKEDKEKNNKKKRRVVE